MSPEAAPPEDDEEQQQPAIETRHFDTAEDFLAALRRTDPYWLSPDSLGDEWLFRGEPNDQHELKPTAWRDDIEDHEIYKAVERIDFEPRIDEIIADRRNTNADFDNKREILRELLVQTTFEHSVVTTFQDMVDELGLPIPGGRLSPRPLYNPLALEITRPIRGPDDLQFQSDIIHPIVALAQHHRMPTRLLDWTLNPLIAAYFAAENAKVGDEGNLLVWAANRTALRNTTVREFIVERSQIGYLRAQQGLFTTIRGANFHYVFSGEWPSMENFVPPEALKRLILPRNQGPALRRLLWAEHISKAHIMPTLDNIKDALDDYWQLIFSKSLPEIKDAAESPAEDHTADD